LALAVAVVMVTGADLVEVRIYKVMSSLEELAGCMPPGHDLEKPLLVFSQQIIAWLRDHQEGGE
jgi:hypothetical protein